VLLSSYYQSLAAYSLIIGLIVLSLVVLTGLVGQVSFCQYSFAAIGAFTVGSLVGGHGWSFWPALLLGVIFSIVVGVLVGIPALRLSGLFLAILTIAVALFFDKFVAGAGNVGLSLRAASRRWTVGRPSVLGISLAGAYAFYLFTPRGVPPGLARGLEPQQVEDRPAYCGRSETRRSQPRRAA